MASKKAILKKIQIVITTHFDTPEDAFNFFDKSGNKKLSKKKL